MDLSVKIGSLELKNPVLVASGTFGYGTEYSKYLDVNKLGGIITKTITLSEREGNPLPRIAETPCGMLNSIGLANVGVEKFIEEKLPGLTELNTVVIVNVAGNTVEEYGLVVEKFQGYDRVDGFEINISCPNVEKGGLAFGIDPELTHKVVFRVREATDKTVIVKLTPNVTDITSIAVAAVEAGADALSLINTILGLGIDIETRRPLLARGVGGLSGPAIKPIALAKVYQVAKAVSVPVIGIGGITCWQDAVEFFIAGATAVEVGTWNFVEPDGTIDIIQGIEEFCYKKNIDNITDLVGRLREG
ncbi:MAG: dihydroorotate dehydrogenase [Candidatus Neomarinimicrobiota bacterium]|nr:MAG: dihydroorotate dehydrogenase [Candidatus Neomarinimicrobiota bacterium]